MGNTRRIYEFVGLAINIDNIAHFRKVTSSDGIEGIEFTFLNGSSETAWYDFLCFNNVYYSNRDVDFEWLLENI